jgi:cell division protein FtsZ
MMGTGEAEGDRRALDAAEAAISNPLLDDVSMKGAKGVLINITGGYDMTLYEVDEAANRIRDEVDPEANIIFGSTFDEKLNGTIRVSVVATGIGGLQAQAQPASINVASPAMARPINMAAAASTVSREPAPSNSVYYGPTSQKAPMADLTNFTVPAGLPENASLGEKGPEVAETTQAEGFSKEFSEPLDPDLFQEPKASMPSLSESAPSAPTPSHREEAGSSEPIGPTEERRRPTSLFERFTGVSRAKAVQPQPELTKVLDTEENEELDMLEIPAFLRRGA